jgi:uncharacterized protein YegJ (DUF2314 family)
MKKLYFVVLLMLCLGLTACGKANPVETRGDETIVGVSDEDAEMNIIIEKARKTVNVFIDELNDPETKAVNFSVKYPFETDDNSPYGLEHIWLSDIEISNDKYCGTVANDPFYVSGIKLGDEVIFDINEISDWQYIEDGYLIGGESILYFYNRMSEQEKADFESEAGFKIKKD